jgi:hypothetical protein
VNNTPPGDNPVKYDKKEYVVVMVCKAIIMTLQFLTLYIGWNGSVAGHGVPALSLQQCCGIYLIWYVLTIKITFKMTVREI